MSSVIDGNRRGTPRPERRSRLRRWNDRIAAAAVRHRFEDARVPFLCECGRHDCEEFVLLTLDRFAELRQRSTALVASGH
jgi:hypothetical protein